MYFYSFLAAMSSSGSDDVTHVSHSSPSFFQHHFLRQHNLSFLAAMSSSRSDDVTDVFVVGFVVLCSFF